MNAPDDLPAMPFQRPNPLVTPPLVRQIQARGPLTKVRTLAGDEAWLVVRYAEVKRLLNDDRLGRSHPDPAHAPRISDSILFGGPAENYATEHADHARMRRLLTPFFSARRMEALRPRVEGLVDELLTALARRSPPVDLHEALSFPLPVLVICELLGVPSADREQFRSWSCDIASLHDRRRAEAALAELVAYMRALVAHKRAHPGDDVISGLCMAEAGSLPDQHVAFLAAMLLFAGHETTVVRIDLGTLLLLTNPDQRMALQADPSLVDTAVEEILRASLIGGHGLLRYPREEVAIGGVTIGAGDAVLLDIGAGNRDPRAFAAPDRFDITRQPNPHLAFGHGPHFCIGAPLARVELRAVFERLLPRFPNLRLAVPVERLRTREGVLTGGLHELPVTW
ncbi:MAG TPA: cytochrome P450 [Candidatus Dormibacteraeota bacterium]|nr:cytochrome P450 [Candidatus Dormibacteraeota bacterium]